MTRLRDYNRSLIGQPGSRQQIETPALVVDLDALQTNIDGRPLPRQGDSTSGRMARPINVQKLPAGRWRQVPSGFARQSWARPKCSPQAASGRFC